MGTFINKWLGIMIIGGMFSMVFLGLLGTAEGQKLIDYGFEDWTGSQDTTPGYIFSTDSETYWNRHKAGTGIIQNSNAGGAYEGQYFWRKQWAENYYDPYLGTTTTYENTYNNIGLNGTYPIDSGDPTWFPSAVNSNILVYRFMVRFPDPIYDHWPGMKFLTQGGNDGNNIFIIIGRAGEDGVRLALDGYGSDTSFERYMSGIADGNWHSFVARFEILSKNNILMQAWFDDWDMAGAPDGEYIADESGYRDGFGDSFGIGVLVMNYGGSNPNDPSAVEFDKFEVWNGDPQTGPDTTPPFRSNGSPTGILASGTTQATLSLNTDEVATCKYSTSPGTAYDSMTNTFTNTDGTSHTTTVSGLSDGNTYNYYVRCKDSSDNKNTDDYVISFSVAEEDDTPPSAPTNLQVKF